MYWSIYEMKETCIIASIILSNLYILTRLQNFTLYSIIYYWSAVVKNIHAHNNSKKKGRQIQETRTHMLEEINILIGNPSGA